MRFQSNLFRGDTDDDDDDDDDATVDENEDNRSPDRGHCNTVVNGNLAERFFADKIQVNDITVLKLIDRM